MHGLAILTFILVAATPASAAGLASLDAHSVDLDASSTHGRLVGIEAAAGPSGGPPATSMHLLAETLEVLVEHEAKNASVATLSGPSDTWRTTHAFTDAAADIATDRRDTYLLLAPDQEDLFFTSDAMQLMVAAAAGQQLQEVQQVVTPREPHVVDITRSHTLAPAAPTNLFITGDLVLVLWDYDVRVESAEGPWAASSGERRTPTAIDTDPLRGAETVELRQFILRATNATLRMDVERPEDVRIHASTSAAAATRADFQDAHGTLASAAGAREVSGDVIVVEGELAVGMARSADHVTAQVEGASGTARIGAEAIVLKPSDGLSPWMAWLVGAFATIAAAAVGLEARFRALRRSAESRDFETAARLAPLLVRLRYRRSDALLLLTIALARLDRLEQAEQAAKRLGDRAQDDVARHYLMAYIAARNRQWGPARRHLHACIEAVPDLEPQIRANPLFSFILAPRPGAPNDPYA